MIRVQSANVRVATMADKVYLYLLKLDGTDLFKIGVSSRPCKRLKQIAAGGRLVTIVRVWQELAYYEKRLHSRYGAYRIVDGSLPASGRTEWFRLTAEQVENIKADCHCERLQMQERN